MLHELNQLASELTLYHGNELAERMVERLEAWSDQFVGTDCRILVVARSAAGQEYFTAASPNLTRDVVASLDQRSRESARDEDWEAAGYGRVAVAKLPFPGHGALDGHLFLLRRDGTGERETEIARVVAHEVSIVLNMDFVDQSWRQRLGQLRHTMLAPVQGILSSAKLLAVIAKERDTDVSEIEELTNHIAEEAEALALRRANQRLYLNWTASIRRRRQALEPVLRRCASHFRPLIERRGLFFEQQWQTITNLMFDFDDQALDIALRNLLDNARKYAFRGQGVRLGAEVLEEGRLLLWVENVGMRVPERLDGLIRRRWRHSTWSDPHLLSEGLGLPMVQTLVLAHGGTLSYCCEKQDGSSDSHRTPYRVRFSIELPIDQRNRRED